MDLSVSPTGQYLFVGDGDGNDDRQLDLYIYDETSPGELQKRDAEQRRRDTDQRRRDTEL